MSGSTNSTHENFKERSSQDQLDVSHEVFVICAFGADQKRRDGSDVQALDLGHEVMHVLFNPECQMRHEKQRNRIL